MSDFEVIPLGKSQKESSQKEQARLEQLQQDLIQRKLEELQNECEHMLARNDIESGMVTAAASILFAIFFLLSSDMFYLGAFAAFGAASVSFLFTGWRRKGKIKKL
jgi:hypothetical protein